MAGFRLRKRPRKCIPVVPVVVGFGDDMGSVKWKYRSKKKKAGPLASHIGDRILGLRDERQVTLQEVADGSGLSKTFVCELENGLRQPSAMTLWKLSGFFGVSPGYWFESFVGNDSP